MSNGVGPGRDAALIRSVDRAVAILDVLAVGGWKAGAEVARELGVHRSTALRLLARQVGETVTLDVLDGEEIVPVEQASGSTSVMSVNWLGTRSPAHCAASGKVILAFGPEAVRSRFLARPLERRTPRTIVDRAQLESQLDTTLSEGYARTTEELEVGLSAIAAPVRAPSGDVVAALDVSGPAHRFGDDSLVEMVARTREAADDLSRRLGFRPQAGARDVPKT